MESGDTVVLAACRTNQPVILEKLLQTYLVQLTHERKERALNNTISSTNSLPEESALTDRTKDIWQDNPLALAARLGHKHVVNVLCEFVATHNTSIFVEGVVSFVNQRNAEGETALFLATLRGKL